MRSSRFNKVPAVLKVLIFSALMILLGPNAIASAAEQIRITELMYDPNGDGSREFIEIYNGSDTTANLSSWRLYGVTFTFPGGTTLGSGQYAVIARNSAALSAAGGSRIIGQYSGKLKGSGELVRVLNSAGGVVSQVSYAQSGAWPSEPRNGGPSLSLIRTSANENLAACWSASTVQGGTPGRANSVPSSTKAGCSSKDYLVSAPATSPPSSGGGGPTGQAPSGSQAPGAGTPNSTSPNQTPQTPEQQKEEEAAAAAEAQAQNEQKLLEEVAKNGGVSNLSPQTSSAKRRGALLLVLTVLTPAVTFVIYEEYKHYFKNGRYKKLLKNFKLKTS